MVIRLASIGSLSRQLKMGVLDNPEEIAEGVEHGTQEDAAPYLVYGFVRLRALLQQVQVSGGGIRHAPVGYWAAGATSGGIGVKAQFVPTDVEAYVEWLIEIRGLP